MCLIGTLVIVCIVFEILAQIDNNSQIGPFSS